MIEAQGLVKAYGSLRAVDGLDLRVDSGEILGLVGPNGAGKTTALRCLSGIIPPDEGRIVIGGHDLATSPVEAKRALAFVPDEPRLFDYLTARDHLDLVARLYGVTDGSERAEELLEEFGLRDRRDAFPSELSRGMKQKLMVAGALLHRPKALIFDEPLTGLDPRAMRRMKRIVLRTAEQGTAVLISSHLLSLVEELCHRIVLLQGGKIVLEGTLGEIRQALPDLDPDADLETIFLHATEAGVEGSAGDGSPPEGEAA